jgi:uncharacterized protein YcbK (DUF882 family)
MGDLSEHFSRAEFACHCGCGFDDISLRLVSLLESLRVVLDEPIHVLSGCRCSKRNHDCGGVKDSQHLRGTAADIQVDSMNPKKLAEFIENNTQFVFGGVGIYKTFTHLDVRQGKARWNG